jgi:hypothetical protein
MTVCIVIGLTDGSTKNTVAYTKEGIAFLRLLLTGLEQRLEDNGGSTGQTTTPTTPTRVTTEIVATPTPSKKGYRKMSRVDHQKILRLTREGLSTKEVAGLMNTSPGTISFWKKRKLNYWDGKSNRGRKES